MTQRAPFGDQIRDRLDRIRRTNAAVMRESVQRTVAEAQRPGPSVTNPDASGGGNMPIASGFLRASIVAAEGEIPAMTAPTPDRPYVYDGDAVTKVVALWTFKNPLIVAWTAAYARRVELRYAFMRMAAMRFPQIVNEVAKEARAGGVTR